MKYLKWCLLLIIPCFLNGCTNYTELNELGVIESMGIEKQNDQFLISVNMISSNGQNEQEQQLRQSYMASGPTILEATQNLYLKSSKKVYLSHLENLLISEEVARYNLDDVITFFINNPKSRNTFTIILTKDISPFDIIQKTLKNPRLNDLIAINSKEYGVSANISFEDFASWLLEEGMDGVMPTIKLENEQLEVDGYAFFQDNHLQAYLTKEEAVIYNMLKNITSNVTFSSSCDQEVLPITLQDINTTYKSKKNNINIQLNANIMIIEKHNCTLSNNDIISLLNKQLKTDINNLLNLQKENNSDILGMVSLIRENNYSYYKQNKDNLLNNINYDININLTYQDTSSIRKEA